MRKILGFFLVALLPNALSAAIIKDYCPMTVGNWWTYQGPRGVLKQTVESFDSGFFLVKDSTWVDGQVLVYEDHFQLNDITGLVEDDFRGYFGRTFFWTPYSRKYKTITVPMGTYDDPQVFSSTGHAIIGPVLNIAVQGIGNVAKSCESADEPTCGYRLTNCHVQTVPEAARHSFTKIDRNSPDSLFSYNLESSDSARLVFRLASRVDACFDVLSSYKQTDSSLRVYVCDSSDTNIKAEELIEHSVVISNTRSMPVNEIRVYKASSGNAVYPVVKYDRKVPLSVAVVPYRRLSGSDRISDAGAGTQYRMYSLDGRRLSASQVGRVRGIVVVAADRIGTGNARSQVILAGTHRK
jgi:hypothetical protein